MEQTKPLIDQAQEWFENSPTAQRAYTRVRADIDAVIEQAKPLIEQVTPMVQDLWAKVGPMIDPPAKEQPTGAANDSPSKPPFDQPGTGG